MSAVAGYFSAIGFKDDELESIVASFQLKTFQKNELIVEEGKTSRYMGLIESGLFQYFVNKEGVEVTTYVSLAGSWLASVSSFINEKPALENIRALTDSQIYLISRQQLRKLVEAIPSFKSFYVNLLEQAIKGIDESRHDLIVLSADQRYAKLLSKEPHLLQQIPLQHLASMLGITPRHLSRIRKTIR